MRPEWIYAWIKLNSNKIGLNLLKMKKMCEIYTVNYYSNIYKQEFLLEILTIQKRIE
jgi:hypothetical protein